MARPFLETLRELRQGRTLDELADHLSDIVAAVRATGKAGQLVLKVTVRPGKQNSTYLVLEDDVLVKLPKADRQDTVFFPTADNNLSRSDPSQMSLGLRAADVATEKVDTETGEIIQSA